MKNTKKITAILIIILFHCMPALSQASRSCKIKGRVFSANDSTPLKNIVIERYAITDSTGFFQIKGFVDDFDSPWYIYDGKIKLKFRDKDETRSVNFQSKDILVPIEDQYLKIYLNPKKDN